MRLLGIRAGHVEVAEGFVVVVDMLLGRRSGSVDDGFDAVDESVGEADPAHCTGCR